MEMPPKPSLHHAALTQRVIGLAIDVHRGLGPGLLESAYEACLCAELAEAGIRFTRQVTLPIIYKSVRLERAYRLDIVVNATLIVEVKAVDRLLPVHDAQLLTYLRLTNYPVGLIFNFNSAVLTHGIRRLVL